MKSIRTSAFAPLVIVTIAACAGLPYAKQAPSTTAPDLADTYWIVEQLGDDSSSALNSLTLQFSGVDRIGGFDGCNSFAGSVAIHGSTIGVSDRLTVTMVACAHEVEARALAYRSALMQANQVRRQGSNLELADAHGKTVVVFAPGPVSLAGTKWEAIAYNNGKQAVVSLIVGTRITAQFDDHGRVTGNGGCNNYFAPYTQSGDTIRIGAPGATRRACAEPNGIMEQEARYLEALSTAGKFRLTVERLELRNAGGSMVATFARAKP